MDMDKNKVAALAKLARIDMPEAEAESLAHEFEGILGYVAEVKKAASSPLSSIEERGRSATAGGGEVNVLREDTNSHESGIYTEAILNQAPRREDGYVAVKNIL